MKGKGKAPQDKEKPVDVKDCSLVFPDLSLVDHLKECPRYAQVLARETAPLISVEELDSIQADIEVLLAGVGKRLKLLNSEASLLNNWPEGKGKDALKKASAGKGADSSRASTPTKRKGGASTPTEDKERERPPSKKSKDSAGRPQAQPATPTSTQRSKGKNSQFKGQPDEAPVAPDTTPDLPKLAIHKNDAVNRFWASVEPYCAPITQDDLKVIEEMLKSYGEETEYMKVPPLGVHYAKRWADEDLSEEQNEGAKITKKPVVPAKDTNGNPVSEANGLLKKVENKKNDYFMDDSPFGPLTQRLVSALIEDNLMTPMDDTMADTAECGDEAPAMSPRMLAKQLNIGNPATLERRIRKELEDQGILEKEEEEEDDPSDEVLAELRRKQQELRAISQSNINILKSLYRQGQEDIQRQDLKKKMQANDSEVMDAYRKIQTAKQKKKSPTKKEKDAVVKALKDRDAVIKALEL